MKPAHCRKGELMQGMRRRTLLSAAGGTAVVGGLLGSGNAQAAAPAARGVPRASGPYDQKIKQLMGRMTVDEKFGQLQQLPWTWDTGPGGGETKAVEDAAR